MIPKEIKYNLHYDEVRGDFLRPPHGTKPATEGLPLETKNTQNHENQRLHKLDWSETWWEASGWHGDLELLKSFSSNIQNGGHGGNLETLQTSDSELLKAIWSDSQDSHHGTM